MDEPRAPRFIHIVDLNGAVEGRPVHTKEVAAICQLPGLSVELGGGLRSIDAVEAALDLGVARVVIGTAAYDNAEVLRALCRQFPGKIVVGIDARHGKVAVKGWKETTSMDAVELAKRCEQDGASRIIYTDISRDGTREGVNLEETLKMARAVNIPIIASGGVATLEDIRKLLPLEKDGVEAVILGRALYAGSSQSQGCHTGRQVAEPLSPLVHIWLPDEVAHRSVQLQTSRFE